MRPRPSLTEPPRNAMTVDVEDYFQVSAFEPHIARDQWERLPCRVERNMERILALFDEYNVQATFFVLGWMAERYPQMVRHLSEAGHEVASHGYEHVRVVKQTPEAFRADIRRTKALLEDTTGQPVRGYRAASYSIGRDNLWALDELCTRPGMNTAPASIPSTTISTACPRRRALPFAMAVTRGFSRCR